MRVGWVDDPRFDAHRAVANHPERPARLDAARRGLDTAALALTKIPSQMACNADLLPAHNEAHLATLEAVRGHRAMLDVDTFVAPKSVDAAFLAAGSTAQLVRLLDEQLPRGISLVRPPGHHAERGRPMGFCLLNNVAIGAYSALLAGHPRVAIVDFDVHHGNGTADIFADERRVLFISIHQAPLYPGSGALHERGNTNLICNIPLGSGATDAVYANVFSQLVLPKVESFEPTLILVSAGFDAYEHDPLASMAVTPRGYRSMMSQLSSLASGLRAPLAMVLEGGYDLAGIELCMEAAATGLVATAPFEVDMAISPAQRAEIDAAKAAHGFLAG